LLRLIRSATANPRIVHQYVDLTIAGDCSVGCGLKLGFERHVSSNAVNISVGEFQVCHRLERRRVFNVAEHDLHAGLRQRCGDS
jgi:hypothetical protein